MPRHSDKTVTEIVDEVATLPVLEEVHTEDALEDAEPVEPETENALRWVDPENAEYYPTIETAREKAQIPPHISVKNLVDKPILIASKKPQKATVPESGEIREGWFCACLDMDTKRPFTTWIGQTALMRDLNALIPPFRCKIVKHGRTYRFES